MPREPDHAILYDADCRFCTSSLDRIIRWDRAGRLKAVPIQTGEGQMLLASIPAERRLDSWHLVDLRDPQGRISSAGAAGPPLLRLLPGGWPIATLLAAFPAITSAAYGWIASHRGLLGRFLVLATALIVAGCGTSVQEGSQLTVYASVPLEGAEAEVGRELVAGMERALDTADAEAGGAPVRLELLDGTPPAPGPGSRTWRQSQIAANARTATENSTAIAYIGETGSDATRVSAPITNDAGLLQLSPGPVERELLAEQGGNGVPREFQPTGERTLATLAADGRPIDPGMALLVGEEAMAVVLDAIDATENPLERASVRAAFYLTADRDSPLGTYTIDEVGRAAYAGPAR